MKEPRHTGRFLHDQRWHQLARTFEGTSGIAGVTTDSAMELDSPLLNKMELDLTSAVILEFQSGASFLNYWEEEL